MTARVLVLESIHPEGIRLLREFAQVDLALRLPRSELLRQVDNVEAVVVKSVTRVDRQFLDAAKRLRVVARAGTGTDNIDLTYASRRDIQVLTVPTGNTVSAAEFTIAQILFLTKRLPEARDAVRAGDFRRDRLEGRELGEMTVGVIGLGNVGTEVAKRLRPFGCRIIGYDPGPKYPDILVSLGVDLASHLDDVLPQAEILTLHAHLTEETVGLLGEHEFRRMRPGSILINSARSALVDQEALIQALDSGRVAAAALDLLSPEPPFDAAPGEHDFDHPLLHCPRVLVTAHMAASTVDAQLRIARDLVDQMRRILSPAPADLGP